MLKALHGTTYVIDYILAIARVIHSERLVSITFDGMHRIIKNYAIDVQVAREIEAGKKWRDYRKKSQEPTFMREAADKTVTAMVLWGFLESPKRTSTGRTDKKSKRYFVRPLLEKVGEEISHQDLQKARLMTFDRILQSEKGSGFGPKVLRKIRDSHRESELGSKYRLPTDGVFLWTADAVRSSLQVSQVDFRMIVNWFSQVGFLNVFNPKILEVKLPQEIYLTVWFGESNELSSVYKKASNGEITDSSVDFNCMKLLELTQSVQMEAGRVTPLMGEHFVIDKSKIVRQSLDDPYSPTLLSIGENQQFRGFTNANELRDMERIYLLSRKSIPMKSFVDVLRGHYDTLRAQWGTPYVWIAPLRALCCRTLMVGDEQFDDMLTQLYKQDPERIEFSKAATGLFRKRVRIFEKPFKLYGNPFRMIRLVGQE